MKRAVLCSAICFGALTALAKDDPRTLSEFASAFRRGHNASNTHVLDSLVCWSNSTAEQRRNMRALLRENLDRQITKIEIKPFTTAADYYPPPMNPNIPPTNVFFVYYNYTVSAPSGNRYLIGMTGHTFKIVIAEGWRARLLRPILDVRSNQTLQPTPSWLVSFCSHD